MPASRYSSREPSKPCFRHSISLTVHAHGFSANTGQYRSNVRSGHGSAVSPTRRIRAMASEAIRDRIAHKPISTDPSQAEGIAGFASRGHGATNGDVSL